MNLVGIMPVRNEDWILGLSLRVALMWCDEVLVLMHQCTDRTSDIIEEVSKENCGCIWLRVDDTQWDEMRHRQMMLDFARKSTGLKIASATHIALIDADEILSANLLPTIRGHVERL